MHLINSALSRIFPSSHFYHPRLPSLLPPKSLICRLLFGSFVFKSSCAPSLRKRNIQKVKAASQRRRKRVNSRYSKMYAYSSKPLLIQKIKELAVSIYKDAKRPNLAHLSAYVKALEHEQLPFGLTVKRIPNLGRCLFLSKTAQKIPTGTFLGYYSGKIVEYSVDEQDGKNLDYALFLSEVSSTSAAFIDAINEGNFTRFCSHSRKANALFSFHAHPGHTATTSPIQLGVTTCKDIHPGEMVLVNYSANYWANKSFIPTHLMPTSYTLNPAGKVVQNDTFAFQSSMVLSILATKRNPLGALKETTVFPDERYFSHLKGQPLSNEEKKLVNDFIEVVKECGITDHFALGLIPDTNQWGVFLKPHAAPIKKGVFIGIYGGEVKLCSNQQQLPLHAYHLGHAKDMTIYVDGSEGNFTSFFQKSAVDCENITAELRVFESPCGVSDDHVSIPDQLQIVFYACKDIQPGEQLLISWQDAPSPEAHPEPSTPNNYLLGKNGQVYKTSDS